MSITLPMAGELAPATIIAKKDEGFCGLDHAFMQVRKMMQFFEQPVPTEPTLLTEEQMKRRSKWIREEMDELEDPAKQTIADQCDALLDAIVFAVGGLVELGVMPQKLLDAVIESQFSKVHYDEEGNPYVKKDAIGKVIKPENWERDFAPEPRMREEIHAQAKHRLLAALTA